jgi:hypothetical protein
MGGHYDAPELKMRFIIGFASRHCISEIVNVEGKKHLPDFVVFITFIVLIPMSYYLNNYEFKPGHV